MFVLEFLAEGYLFSEGCVCVLFIPKSPSTQ